MGHIDPERFLAEARALLLEADPTAYETSTPEEIAAFEAGVLTGFQVLETHDCSTLGCMHR